MPPRIRASYGKPFSRLAQLENSPDLLRRLGACLVDILSKEAKKYFARRGWTGHDPMGGPDIWDSFSYQIRGKSTVEVTSSFYGMDVLAKGDIPERKMEWLTQEAKEKHPGDFALTRTEKKLGMKKTGRPSRGGRLPLIVPVKSGNTVLLRMAPLTIGDAWVHPGIAKFTFFETAYRKGREECARIIRDAVASALSGETIRL